MSLSPDPNPREADSLLRQFISAKDPLSAESYLDALLSQHAEPIIRTVIHGKLAAGSARSRPTELQDHDDICNEALFQLLNYLRKLRESGDSEAIMNFSGYVYRTALNAFNAHLRTKHPKRSRFKDRIRYLMNHRSAFATWENANGDLVCGFDEWKHSTQGSFVESGSISLQEFLRAADRDSLNNSEEFFEQLFRHCKHPIVLDEMVTHLAEFAEIRDLREIDALYEDKIPVCELLADPSPDAATLLDQKRYLTHLWSEICALPHKQRIALLLNLRDSNGDDALDSFTSSGITSLRKIAEVLEFQADAFARLWNRLPLDDHSIALEIGVTRQQVINYRKSARERLARRMAAQAAPKKKGRAR